MTYAEQIERLWREHVLHDRGSSDKFIEYITKDGTVKKYRLKDGYLYQVVPKERWEKILKDGKITPVKIDHNTVPFMEPLSPEQAAKGKIFFTPAQEMSEGLATSTNYGPGVVNKIDIKALKDIKVYHDPHVISEVPSFYVTEPIDAKHVAYSVDDGKKFIEYTTATSALKRVATQAKVIINIQQELKDYYSVTSPTMQEGMTIGFNLGRLQNGGAAVTTNQLFDIPSAQKALETITLKAAKKALNTTTSDLEKIISENIKYGGGAQDLAAKISEKYQIQYLGRRSMTIARTEGTGVLNLGTLEQMKEDKVNGKWWRATLDGRQRETHKNMMKETQDDPIPVDETFDFPDGSGLCPGDPSLPIEERAQCRCALVNGDFSKVRCTYYDKLFLRQHGSFERKLQQAVNVYFKKMLNRINSNLDKIDYPTH